MNAENALKLARRFIELPQEKRRLFLDGLREEGVDFSLLPIPADVAAADRAVLSYAQRRMWFLWQLDPHGAAYNLPMAVRLKGNLERTALQRAFDALVARHESLRTRFRQEGDDVCQQVLDPVSVNIDAENLISLSPSEREERITVLAEAEAQAPFDLGEGPLLRVRLLKLEEQEHVLLLTLHHIVADGWSLNLLIDEFLRLYDAACDGQAAELPALLVQYRDYAVWQRSWLEAGEQDRQLAYWRDKLGDDHAPLALPVDHSRSSQPSHRGARHAFQIDTALAERLRTLARQHNATLFMVLLSAFKLLLQRYSGQTTIRVGVPIANRHRAEVEGLIGCFINTQVLHTEIDPLIDVTELLRRIRETALGAQAHQDLPFEQLVEALELDRGTGQSPLFQVLFNHQPNVADVRQLTTHSGLTLERVESTRHTARFDLALDTYESAGRLYAAFTYALDLFDAATVARLEEHWLHLLRGIAEEGATIVGELPLPQVPDEPVVHSQEQNDCVHQVIERAASRYPEQLAAVSGDETISYARLNERADELAQVLLAAEILPDQRVGVVGDRSIDMLVGILGTLKAGAAYLPLEPEQPQERLEFMLADSDVHLVLGHSSWGGALPDGVQMIALDEPLPPVPGRAELPVLVSPGNLAYVIYTSGTTGMPKGVAVSHGALVNYIEGIARRLPLEAIDSMAMVSTPAADLGHTVLYGALCMGKILHLLDKETVLDAEAFGAYMDAHKVDVLKIVPSHLDAMLSAGRSALPGRCLILGGEACPPALLARIATLAPRLTLFNHYGPTETTVGVLAGELQGQPVLGGPLENIGTRVLDACLQTVPGAARGELYISGVGLARGYLGHPALTAERFVPDPAGTHGGRMYRTGDWVRRNGEGELLFAGRMDGQVKIRGYRVELAEIESRLRALPGVGNALLRVIGEEHARQLVAYLVPAEALGDQAEQAFLDEVRSALKRALPEHMVPTHLLALECLPVTANGKVDLKALPEPVASSASYVAPITPLQAQLAEIWAEVLQVERVGLTDNFFELGGHSLLATQIVSRARKRLGLDIPLRTLFDTADLQGFVQAVQGSERGLDAEIELIDRNSPLPVSHAQHRQWLFWKLNPESAAYNTPLAVRVRGTLDRQALQGALDALVARHESLRTVFQEVNGLPWQRILPAIPVTIGYEGLDEQDEEFQTRRLEEEAFATFNLEQGPLIRARLFKVREDEHLLAVTLHHIVSDGWSMSVMVREFAAAYNARSVGRVQGLQPLPVQYADYAAWQRQRLAEGQMQAQLTYWKAKLEDDFEVLELPVDRIRPPVQSHRGGRIDIRLSAELIANLRRLAVEANATLFHVFLAVFAILLSRYSGRDKINIGVPVTNRNRLELEGLIGFFVNSIVARIGVDPAIPFSRLLETVKETTLEAQANKDIPFDVLVEELKPERGLGYNPLFQVMYNHLRDFGEQVSADSLHGLHVEEVDLVERTAQLDISLNTLERSDGVTAIFNYSSDLFEVERIHRLVDHWRNLLHGIAGDPQQRIADLSMLDDDERRLIIHDWNATGAVYPLGRAVHQLIEEQAERTPLAPALVFAERSLSYAQLNARANRLAHKLVDLGVGPDILVGIAVERSIEMVVGLLAILKAGGAYVPLDPEYPRERLAYMLDDSGVRLLLSQSHLDLPLAEGVRRIDLGQGDDWLEGYAESNLGVALDGENLAYVIYTSGSTGKPKGVMVRHDALINFITSMAKVPGIAADARVLSLTTFSFDIFALELYLPLTAGALVVLANKATSQDPENILDLVQGQRIDTLQATPSTWRMLVDSERSQALSSCACLCGGEAMAEDLAMRLRGIASRVWNLYGPTETTIWSATHELTKDARTVTGRPIDNTSLYILDTNSSPVPVGIAGELLIGGAGLARGYYQRPALTAERFLPDPFGRAGGRMYRTGDLARYQIDGVVEYIGRIDHQVKIRGFRIELGEIEARLLEHETVREAAVVAQEGPGGQQLVGYVVLATSVSAEQQGALGNTLRAALKTHLPDYMVPAHLLFMERMPLTPNGKLDRKALPRPDASLLLREYVEPCSELEQQVAAIWAEVLGLERVGLGDNFFELGGHSLLATQVASRIRYTLGMEVPLRSLFERATLGEFILSLDQGGAPMTPAMSQVERGQPLPLSYAQERQWFLWQLEPEGTAYHIPTALRLRGTLHREALQRSFSDLLARHEILRTTFALEDERPVQIIHPPVPLSISEQTLDTDEDTRIHAWIEREVRQPFDLQHGPLLRVTLLRLAENDHVLLLVQHHIVSDGWSMQLMVEELVQSYTAHCQGQPTPLHNPPIQYADYAFWQRRWMEAGERERQLVYWQEYLGNEHPVLELPSDRPRPAIQSYRGARLHIPLALELGQSLKALAQHQGVTVFMLLMASFQVLLHRYSGQDEIRIGVPIANRNRVETERLIGFFVNTQVLRARIDSQASFQHLLIQVKQSALAAQIHQDLPFEQLVEALQPERSLSHNPLFQVMYNHQTQVRSERRSLPGLEVEELKWASQAAQFDLTLDTFEYEGGIGVAWTYARDLFDVTTVERMSRHWNNLLHGIVTNPQQRIADLSMLDDDERRLIIHDWNATGAVYPLGRAVHQLIEEQAERTPLAPALVFAERSLSYAQLNARANRLAHKLVDLGVGPDILVGIAVERSIEMVVGLLAILKAGGAYVPLDPEYPRERLAYMLDDSGVRLLLSQSHLDLPLAEGVRRIDLDQGDDWLEGYAESNLGVALDGENLAYVIYTSGSTGKPKGAGNRHSALINRLYWMQQAYSLDDSDSVLQKTPFSFDVSVWEFFWPLMTGARLVVAAPGDHRDPERLVALINRECITTLHFVPSMLQAFLQDPGVASCTSLKRIVCSGEALPVDAQQQVFAKLPQAGLHNLYGPTEAAIDVTHWTCVDEGKDSVPIGKPITNLGCHILDDNLEPVPVGGLGELYLAGEGLARGYHRRPALSAERFVASPFGTGKRLYRSGDLARYRADGVIEYAGRIDHQVKLRGLRVELGEIEARLVEQVEVREAVVLARDGANGKYLVGYLVPVAPVADEEQDALRERLKVVLRAGLPEHMVPTHLLCLEAMPLTPNGKLDRKALPEPDIDYRQQAYLAPRTELEQRIAAIWAEVLKVERVGLSDNFFELGGHSLLATQVMVRIRERLGVEVVLRELFESPSLAGFSQAIQGKCADIDPIQDELAKSLAALKRLTAEEIEELIS